MSTGAGPDFGFGADAARIWDAAAANDGLRNLTLHPKQQQFVEATEREVMFIGANRSGKSKGLAARIARRLRRDGISPYWIVCPSFAMARQNVLGPLFGDADNKPMIPPSEIEREQLKPEWKYWGRDGWELTIKSCEQGAISFAGATVREIAFDEPPTWPIYNECAIRFGAGRDCLLRLAATLLPPPGQAGGICQWLWSEKIEPWLNGRAKHDLKIINVAMHDNPHITAEQLALARRLYPLGSLDARIRVDGELLPGLLGARCYRFERRLHKNDQIGRATADPLKPLYLGCDFNVDPLGWVVMQKAGPRLWRVLDEISLHPGTIERGAVEFRQRYAGHRATVLICGDATGKRRTAQTGQTDYDLLIAALKDHFTLDVRIPEINPPERDRVNLVNFLLGGGESDVELEVSGKDCPETIADFEQVLWAKDGSKIRKANDPNDPYYQRTAWTDALGYTLWLMESYRIRDAASPRRQSRRIPAPSYGFTA